MASFDERDIDAEKFWQRLKAISATLSRPSDGWRFSLLVQFIQLSRHQELDERVFHRNDFYFDSPKDSPLSNFNTRELGRSFDHDANAIEKHFSYKSTWPRFSEFPEDVLLPILSLVLNADIPFALMLYRFDYVFMQVANESPGIDVKRIKFLVAFAASLAENATSIADVFTSTADFTVLLKDRFSDEKSFRSFLTIDNDLMLLELNMRLWLRDVNPKISVGNLPAKDIYAQEFIFYLNTFTSGYRSTTRSYSSGIHRHSHPLDIALEFVHNSSRGQMAVVPILTSDLRRANKAAYLRDELVRTRVLAAVVELPREAVSSTSWSVLFFHNTSARDGILFIQGKALSGLTGVSLENLAEFLSEPIKAEYSPTNRFRENDFSRHMGDLLGSRAERLFNEQYKDVPGLCRLVAIDEILDRGADLTPELYVSSNQENGWNAILDSRPIRELLKVQDSLAQRIYVIGNNGEGKSFLLRELATEITDLKNRDVFAIAFGATDRFFGRKKSMPNNYFYLGSRAGIAGVDPRRTAEQAAALMAHIYSDKDLLEAFNVVASLIGFRADHYLMPIATGSLAKTIVQIDKLEAGTPIAFKGRKLGVKRSETEIVPFDELSSGEQQILLLCAKVVARATSGALFLIDEPETSLHVGWQQILPDVFAALSTRFDIDFVIATHSPVVIASATNPQDHCFVARAGAIQAISRHDVRSVETALFEGFRVYTENNREVHERCAELVSKAIVLSNSEGRPDRESRRILAELDDMEKIVLNSSKGGSSLKRQRDLELIKRAGAAISEAIALPAEGGTLG